MTYSTILIEEQDAVLHVTLNRPAVHNAFNAELIEESIDLFESVERRTDLRVIVLSGSGANFCAGADLNWMSTTVAYTREENARDSSRLARMFAVMDDCPLPLVGRIQGAAIGGGVGLVSVCDIAIATAGARFGLSEVKLGILPAVISPYVIAKIGESHARSLFLTGERFPASRALQIGLIHHLVDDDGSLDKKVEEAITGLRSSGPEAVRACKRLIQTVANSPREEAIAHTIEAIAERRTSGEGQAGMQAFLRKEKPPWLRD